MLAGTLNFHPSAFSLPYCSPVMAFQAPRDSAAYALACSWAAPKPLNSSGLIFSTLSGLALRLASMPTTTSGLALDLVSLKSSARRAFSSRAAKAPGVSTNGR
ncbi:hypothetical protein D3C76_1602000 [compost metagenome]